MPWNSNLDDFLVPAVKVEGTVPNFEQYKFYGGFTLFVLDGRIKGYSRLIGMPHGYDSYMKSLMDIFKVKYEIRKTKVNDRDALLAIKKGHVIREISGDKFNTLQFFEADFFNEKVTEIK